MFAVGGACTRILASLDVTVKYWQRHSAAQFVQWLLPMMLTLCVLGLVMMFALRNGNASGGQVARRPRRFLVVLIISATVLDVARGAFIPAMSIANFVEGWLNITLWGALYGWLYIQYLQRGEDRVLLDDMLTQRALLARQLAQSQLTAARARIDPAMVAQVLREVHARYAHDPQAGAALLDQLIGYLRLALNRSRAKTRPAAELDEAALRALLAAAHPAPVCEQAA